MALLSLIQYLYLFTTPRNGLKLLLTLVAISLYKYRAHAIGTRPRKDLKQPQGAWPILGHLPLIASIPETELYQFFVKQNKALGPVWSISLPGFGRLIQIDTPENLEHVLKTNFWSYEKGSTFKEIMWELIGNGIFCADGPKWKFQRQLAARIFNIKAFREYTSDIFVIEGKKVVEHLGKAADGGVIVDFQALMLNYTLDCFGAVSFGKSFGCLDKNKDEVPLAAALDDVTEACTARLVDPLWKIRERLTGVNKKVRENRALLSTHACEIINRRRLDGGNKETNRKDFLDLFMEGKDDEGNPLSDELIVDTIITFTAAARDTTANALTWMMYLLYRDGTDKKIAETMVREVDDVLGTNDPSYMTYKQQKFAEACFYETLRIYPSLPRNLRYCSKDDILPDGTKIYAGEWVSWSSYVMGRSETLWGPDALLFKPARWLESDKPSQFKFNSFHAGPRVCLGQQFATIQALTLLGMIHQSFDFQLEEPAREPDYGTSLAFPMLEGLKVRVSRRISNGLKGTNKEN